jgi:hypothetical protein
VAFDGGDAGQDAVDERLGRDEAGLHVDDQEGLAQSFSEGICGALADLFAGKPDPAGGV